MLDKKLDPPNPELFTCEVLAELSVDMLESFQIFYLESGISTLGPVVCSATDISCSILALYTQHSIVLIQHSEHCSFLLLAK